MSFLSALAALLLLSCCLSSAYLLVLGWGGRRSGSQRLGTTLALAYGLLIAVFEVLASAGGFTVWAALPLWVLLTVLLGQRWHPLARRALRWDGGRARVLGRHLGKGWTRWLLLAAALLLGARLLRGLAAPPLAWDALTYHLVKAGRWVQTGGYSVLLAPDAWSYYEFFLPYGDALWAWAMLPAHGDGFLAPAGLLVWLSALGGAYATARVLGARRRMAVPAALVSAFLPAVVTGLTSAYVDNTVLALFLLGLASLLRVPRSGLGVEAVASVAALGVLAGVKPGGLPVFCLGLGVLAWGLLRAPRSTRVHRTHAVGLGLGVLLGVLPYVRTWAITGSALYPWPISLAGMSLSPGNPELAAIDSGVLFGNPPVRALEVVRALFLSKFGAGWDHLGLGPALLLAPVGVVAAVRASRRRWEGLVLAVCGLVSLLGVKSPTLWSVWTDSSPRFLACMMAALLLLASMLEGSWLRLLLWSCLGVELVLGVPRGWSQVDVRGVLQVALPALVALAGVAVAVGRGGKRPLLAGALAAVLLAVCWVPITFTRDALRYDFYSAAVSQKTFDLHPLQPSYVSSWPLWKALDDETPKRLAVTAGWDGLGHNWYWYPLMGSHLRNTLTYVPVLPDGSVGDYALQDTLRHANFNAWRERLLEEEVDFAVTLAPPPPEAKWMSAHPELFQPLTTSLDHGSAVWRIPHAPAEARP